MHAAFQLSSARGTFLNSELNEGGRNNVRFSMENWLYFENDERYGQVTNWKSHTPFLMKRKLSTLDNLEGH